MPVSLFTHAASLHLIPLLTSATQSAAERCLIPLLIVTERSIAERSTKEQTQDSLIILILLILDMCVYVCMGVCVYIYIYISEVKLSFLGESYLL